MREAEVWNKLNHENIIRLYGVTLTEPFKMVCCCLLIICLPYLHQSVCVFSSTTKHYYSFNAFKEIVNLFNCVLYNCVYLII